MAVSNPDATKFSASMSTAPRRGLAAYVATGVVVIAGLGLAFALALIGVLRGAFRAEGTSGFQFNDALGFVALGLLVLAAVLTAVLVSISVTLRAARRELDVALPGTVRSLETRLASVDARLGDVASTNGNLKASLRRELHAATSGVMTGIESQAVSLQTELETGILEARDELASLRIARDEAAQMSGKLRGELDMLGQELASTEALRADVGRERESLVATVAGNLEDVRGAVARQDQELTRQHDMLTATHAAVEELGRRVRADATVFEERVRTQTAAFDAQRERLEHLEGKIDREGTMLDQRIVDEVAASRASLAAKAEELAGMITKERAAVEAHAKTLQEGLNAERAAIGTLRQDLARRGDEIRGERDEFAKERAALQAEIGGLREDLVTRGTQQDSLIEARVTEVSKRLQRERDELSADIYDQMTKFKASIQQQVTGVAREMETQRGSFSEGVSGVHEARAEMARIRDDLVEKVEAARKEHLEAVALHRRMVEEAARDLRRGTEELSASTKREHEALSEFARRQSETLTQDRTQIELVKSDVSRGLGELREEIRRERAAVDDARASFERLRGRIDEEIQSISIKAETNLGDIQEYFEKNLGRLLQGAEEEVEGLSHWVQKERENLEVVVKDEIAALKEELTVERAKVQKEVEKLKTEFGAEREKVTHDFSTLDGLRNEIAAERERLHGALDEAVARVQQDLSAEIERVRAESINNRLANALEETFQRSRYYTRLGAFLLGGIVIAVVLALVGVGSPGLLATSTAFAAGGITLIVLTVTILMLLFALGDAFRRIRKQIQ